MTASSPTFRTILINYAALMALLVITAVASRVPLGGWKTPLSLIIAAVKMALVFLFFMRLWYQAGLIRIFALAGFFWLAIILALTFADYLTRGWLTG
jgi:cytochrome c oxidase subunit 4